jgi:phosphoribosylamine---glycine ligase
MKGKNVLVIDDGGRGKAFGWKLEQSEYVGDVFHVSENESFGKIYDLIESKKIDLTLVGPENILDSGIVDYLNSRGCYGVFGPTKLATKIESDKFFSFELADRLGIFQADSVECYTLDEAREAIKERTTEDGIVAKARGLARGKGVGVFDSGKEAIENLEELVEYDTKYKEHVLVSERLRGKEFSFFGISDGKKVIPFKVAFKDYKRLLDGDNGPNTGGVGSYGPASFVTDDVVDYVVNGVMNPVVDDMKRTGMEFKGFLYAGMMVTKEGVKLIEFNARMGNPECQAAMMLLKDDLYEILSLGLHGKLDGDKIDFNPGTSCCVVLTSRGYPGNERDGFVISGLHEVEKMNNVEVFHAGTEYVDGVYRTKGGRVLDVVAYGKDILEARNKSYEAVSRLTIPGGFHFREDIGDLNEN